jgi:peptidoglycan-N-acetylglucosamine deacetylase
VGRGRRGTHRYGIMLILLLLLTGLALVSLRDRYPEEPPAVYFVSGNPDRVSLTFETLWSSSGLDQVLAILEHEGISATFFITGAWLRKNPEAARQILGRGHEIGNHTDYHKPLLYLDKQAMVSEITGFNNSAAELLEYRPTLFRPPRGQYSGAVLKAARSQGCRTIIWSVDSYDLISKSEEELVQRVSARAHGGAIFVFRIGAPLLSEALPDILMELKQAGYEAVPVSKLLESSNQ